MTGAGSGAGVGMHDGHDLAHVAHIRRAAAIAVAGVGRNLGRPHQNARVGLEQVHQCLVVLDRQVARNRHYLDFRSQRQGSGAKASVHLGVGVGDDGCIPAPDAPFVANVRRDGVHGGPASRQNAVEPDRILVAHRLALGVEGVERDHGRLERVHALVGRSTRV